jgi:primosomal protein N' (replication factor Y) (superfamily II helicase)
LDRPFTYVMSEGSEAGLGSLVSVPFHGRTLRGWILGPAAEVPSGRILPVTRVRSRVRFFDERMLALLRWMSERYIAPLATVIGRSYPPRVAGEENPSLMAAAVNGRTPRARLRSARGGLPAYAPRPSPSTLARQQPLHPLSQYLSGNLLEPGTTTWLRPLPGEEAATCVDAVEACLAVGRQAIVLLPEAEPISATARAVLDRFGQAAVSFMGGDARSRYRTWLEIRAGMYTVVVGTRPAVFAPLADVGLIWISREVHFGHRERRSPYYHVREVASARTRIDGAACVLASLSPSVEAAAAVRDGTVRVARPSRGTERAAAPMVETAPPQAEDRSARLTALLKRARSAALVVSRRGYGVARVCQACREPAACARCRGPIVVVSGAPRCAVCATSGACANCGAGTFGVERGGTERLAEWAGRYAEVPVSLADEATVPPVPQPGRVLVGTAAAVKDVGPVRLDLVAILDPDRALGRAGFHSAEQALATWMEAAAWAGPRGRGGRVLLHTRRPAHPAIQALIRWDPIGFLLGEATRRRDAGFPPGHPVFRVEGTSDLGQALAAAEPETILTAAVGSRTVCLVAVSPERLPRFRHEVLRLATDGTVTRVEAEPQP